MPAPTNEQIDSLRRAARNAPRDGRAYYQLGMALMSAGRFEEAAEALRESSQQAPQEIAVRGNYGIALAKAGKSEESLRVLLEVAQRAPNIPEMHFNVGNAYRDLARPTEGAPAYARAIALRANYPDAHWNRATALLLTEQFDEGWREFEWRFRLPGRPPIPFPGQLWNGDLALLKGKTIVLAGEQGYGDVIQFVRYVPILADAGARVIVAAQTDLKSLLLTVPGVVEAIAPGDLVPRYDFVAALMSLGMLMKTTVATIPSNTPYLAADKDKRAIWRGRLAPYSSTQRVGLVWAGRPTHNNDKNRSMRFADLAPLMTAPGVSFFNLQKGPAADQIRLFAREEPAPKANEAPRSNDTPRDGETRGEGEAPAEPLFPPSLGERVGVRGHADQDACSNQANPHPNRLPKGHGTAGPARQEPRPPMPEPHLPDLIDWTNELNDWSDTAALVSELDLVITVDTAVAHLAGALGKPVWTMLPFAPDWRWMLTRPTDTPWYPSMKLFRQPARGQWPPVVEAVVCAFEK